MPTSVDDQFVNLQFPPIGVVTERLGLGQAQEFCQSGVFDRMAKQPHYVEEFVKRLSNCDPSVRMVVHQAILKSVPGKFGEVYIHVQSLTVWTRNALRTARKFVFIVGALAAGVGIISGVAVAVGISARSDHQSQIAVQHAQGATDGTLIPVLLGGLALIFLTGISGFCAQPLPPRFGMAARILCVVPNLLVATSIALITIKNTSGTDDQIQDGVLAVVVYFFTIGFLPISQFAWSNFLAKDVRKRIVACGRTGPPS
jgi:hypothetical protein